MDRLDRSRVEIKASRDTTTGFITLDHSCKKNPKHPQIEASRRKVQEMQWIRVFGNDRLVEILTVIRLGLPQELRRSLACTNIIENVLGTVRQVSRNVKRWRNAEMALRRTAAGTIEAQKSFRRLKAYRQLPLLRSALQDHMRKTQANSAIETIMNAA